MSTFQLPPIDNAKQFELLIADLLNEHYQTISFKCFGKNGHKQKGIDVISTEKKIVIQCKHKDLSRPAVKIKKELLEDIDKTLADISSSSLNIDFDTLIVATTASEHVDYDEYKEALVKDLRYNFQVLFWGWETIQNKLSHSPATWAKHYPQFPMQKMKAEEILVSKLTMKKKIERDFSAWLKYSVANRKVRSRMIIHSSTDNHYPEHKNEHGPWYWFAAEIARLSTNGLGFYTGLDDIYLDEDNFWTDQKPENLEGYRIVRALKVEIVNFHDIVDYDMAGDEYYNCPHFYLRFNSHDSPFSDMYYEKVEGQGLGIPLYLDKSTKL